MAHEEETEVMALEFTPTWIVAAVCSLIVFISLLAERGLHYLGKVCMHALLSWIHSAVLFDRRAVLTAMALIWVTDRPVTSCRSSRRRSRGARSTRRCSRSKKVPPFHFLVFHFGIINNGIA